MGVEGGRGGVRVQLDGLLQIHPRTVHSHTHKDVHTHRLAGESYSLVVGHKASRWSWKPFSLFVLYRLGYYRGRRYYGGHIS